MITKLDRIDKQILDLLTEDGRMSCAVIARRVGKISERAVRYRLERMLAEKVFVVSAVIDPAVIGYPVIADVFVEIEPGLVNEVANRLATFDQVTYVACSTGDRDISIQVVARDNRELYDFVSNVLGRITGVRRTTTSIVPFIVKDDARWRIPDALVNGDA
ncbi:transcriptional regulator, AsnC family [Longilinea arvoryzae]|uniref:Transcriptional regulator, AsnC family n=1 Tax=Longilinea arvoryzae TaxID=360412 RepID=A0A0S7BDH0_9CHLR|nr:Lrp/AsnC family transcriptional regulator [Longilinea arvoryzae]GAP15822.1 transcriptional regulator, AsnC family [Longilinea arvoryzae]